jgi:phosphoserine phosphatase
MLGAGGPVRPYDLICFDVDGTLVIHPEGRIVWEILNTRFTGGDEANRTRFLRYRDGEITYAEWVALDVGDWLRVHATRSQILDAIVDLRLIGRARETLAELKRRGYKLAVVSGTLDIVLDTLFPDHPFDDVFVNRLHFDLSGRLAGWTATPYDVDGKARALREIAGREEIPLERCAFVGDAFNDVEIAREAGFAIALNSRCAELIGVCDVALDAGELSALLPYFPRAAV